MRISLLLFSVIILMSSTLNNSLILVATILYFDISSGKKKVCRYVWSLNFILMTKTPNWKVGKTQHILRWTKINEFSLRKPTLYPLIFLSLFKCVDLKKKKLNAIKTFFLPMISSPFIIFRIPRETILKTRHNLVSNGFFGNLLFLFKT